MSISLYISSSLPYIIHSKHVIFSHPDFTVGSGFSPDRPPARFTDFSAYAVSPSVGNIAYASTLPRRIPYIIFIHYKRLYVIIQEFCLSCLYTHIDLKTSNLSKYLYINIPFQNAKILPSGQQVLWFHLST